MKREPYGEPVEPHASRFTHHVFLTTGIVDDSSKRMAKSIHPADDDGASGGGRLYLYFPLYLGLFTLVLDKLNSLPYCDCYYQST